MTPGQLAALEDLLLLDPGERNVRAFFVRGALEQAARGLFDAERTLITSGFPVRTADGSFHPETDGPDAAVALGDALTALGSEVRYVCGPVSAPLFTAMGAAPLDALDLQEPTASAEADAYLERFAPTHLVAIERPGRARDGRYHSMRGQPIAGATSALDALFLTDRPGLTTIAIGDGGNEVGMGALHAQVASAVPHGEQIASVVPADVAVVAGVSTWGGYALVAALSLLAGRDLLPSAATVSHRLRTIVGLGAVDGFSGRPEPTVDGQSLAACLEVLDRARSTLA